MRDDLNEEGQELFISMEGVSYREPNVTAKQILYHVRKFLIYLLVPSNMIIGKIVSSAFEGMAPPSRSTLSWVHELQRTEVALQNALSINRLTVARSQVKAMKRILIILLHSVNQLPLPTVFREELLRRSLTSRQLSGCHN